VIGGLPRGYDTMLGTWIEKGEELSLGEWQKIALARAFYSESDLLVLDEPTSALDAAAEVQVFEELRRIARDRAVLVISHRFSTVRMADRIYVMDRGRIIEVGTHEHLMGLGGTYAHLFEAQAAAYWPTGVETGSAGGGGVR
jgi:ATP-binding cassette subfamily B protein